MSMSVDFVFDFGSPNAYLAYHALPGIKERTGAEFRILPCLLGGIFKSTGNQSPIFAYPNVKGKLNYDRLEIDRFVKRYGVSKFRFNKHFPVNTVMLMRGAVAAQMDGQFDTYLEAGLRAMWEDSEKMDDPEVFARVFTEAGLDGAQLLARTQDQEVKDRLFANTAAAVERGAFGMPTFFVGDEMFFGKERLVQVEEEIIAQQQG